MRRYPWISVKIPTASKLTFLYNLARVLKPDCNGTETPLQTGFSAIQGGVTTAKTYQKGPTSA
jgi:hypothetical protein